MTVWRISNHQTLDGRGGLRAAARWHSRGHRIVYCGPNPATALLEMLVHAEIEPADLPVSYRFLEISVPDRLRQERIDERRLSANWFSDMAETQFLGDEWLHAKRTPILLVPCAIVPETFNVLVNPLHPQANKIAIKRVHRHDFDKRLIAS